MSGPQSKQKELSYFSKKLLTHSERTMGECVVDDTGYIGDRNNVKRSLAKHCL